MGSFSARTRLAAASPPVSMILAYSSRNPGQLRWRRIAGVSEWSMNSMPCYAPKNCYLDRDNEWKWLLTEPMDLWWFMGNSMLLLRKRDRLSFLEFQLQVMDPSKLGKKKWDHETPKAVNLERNPGFLKWRYPNKWFIMESPIKMDEGYPHFWKHWKDFLHSTRVKGVTKGGPIFSRICCQFVRSWCTSPKTNWSCDGAWHGTKIEQIC